MDFSVLPETIKEQIIHLLQRDNFPEAKKMYDRALNNQPNHIKPM